MDDLAERITRLEDRNAISELRSKYCWYTTRGERDAVIDLFTDDCLFVNHRGHGERPAEVRGREALRAHLSRMTPGRRIPMVMNEVVEITGTTASGTCVMNALGEDPFCGHYVDGFEKVDGVWKFSVRRFFPYAPIFRPDVERRDP